MICQASVASQFRQPVETVTQAFVANGADSRVRRELEFAVQYARTRLSALRALRSAPVRRELEGLDGLHQNELG